MIDRKTDRERVGAALQRSRVVALVGPRQSGKTTLARQLVPADSAAQLFFCKIFEHETEG